MCVWSPCLPIYISLLYLPTHTQLFKSNFPGPGAPFIPFIPLVPFKKVRVPG